MTKTLIIAEQRNGKLKQSSLELVWAFSSAGHEVHALVMGEGISSTGDELGAFGAKKIHLADNPSLKLYHTESYCLTASNLISSLSPDYVVAAHTPLGRDLMPHLSARANAGLASDCTSIKFDSDRIVARRPVYAGKATAEVEFLGAGPRFISVRPNSLGNPVKGSGVAETTKVEITANHNHGKTVEILQGSLERPDVTEAAIVVSGGRALANAENFSILEKLADVVGAAVGASRAAVDAGYRPHRDQVGQTGKVVSPSLYMAFGISGAIQHLAGMRTSKTIVAINTDPEAPIFQVADYGVVADLFTLAPLLTEEFSKIKEL